MQSSPSIEGYKLPANVDPPGDLCLTIRIPNDPAYVQAVIGALYDTTLWISWQRDAAHTGIRAARKMKPRWFEAVQSIGLCEPVAPGGGGLIEEDFMPIRVDCDCNVFITCCDGTEKQILTADQVKTLIQGQPSNNVPQPAPGGGCQTISMRLEAGKTQVIPVPVSTGDTIQISAVDGAMNEDLVLWFCQSGQAYYAGECQGPSTHFTSDPFPLLNHGSLLIDVGLGRDGLGTALYTVPGGVSNVQPALSANMSFGLGANGFYTFLVTVCNNQPKTWTHVFDLTTLAGPLSPVTQAGTNPTWTPGSGWTQGNTTNGGCPGGNQDEGLLWIELFVPAPVFISTVEWFGNTDTNNGSGSGDRTYEIDGTFTSLGLDSSVGPFDVTFPIGFTVNTSIGIRVNSICFPAPPNITITKLILTGTGTDPF
jgi:hypothetical protein